MGSRRRASAPIRLLALFAHFALAALVPARARADAAPQGVRGLEYKWTIANRDKFPNHALLIYPTSNHGFSYLVEEGKGLTNLMRRSSYKGPATRLYAMKKADFEKFSKGAHRYDHGDKGEQVMVLPPPPSPPEALKADAAIEPPPLVAEESSVLAVERTFRIKTLSDAKFELELTEEVWVHKNGKREKRSVAK